MIFINYIIIIMINILNAKFEQISLKKFLNIAAILCLLSDIANVIYFVTKYLPLNINRVLLQKALLSQGVNISNLNSFEIQEFRQLYLDTFSTIFFIFLIIHVVIYILLSLNKKWAKKYVSNYALIGAILTIATIPFMISNYGHYLWSAIMFLTCIIYFYIYWGLRFFKKKEL